MHRGVTSSSSSSSKPMADVYYFSPSNMKLVSTVSSFCRIVSLMLTSFPVVDLEMLQLEN